MTPMDDSNSPDPPPEDEEEWNPGHPPPNPHDGSPPRGLSSSTRLMMIVHDESSTLLAHPSSPQDMEDDDSSPDDPEDDDNWSRQVETDEMVRVPSSVLEDDGHGDEDDDNDHDDNEEEEASPEVPPQREEPTLKEKLVERERQRRVETERARLKRHFALRESAVVTEEEEEGDNEAVDESVAGTVGEGSIVAPVDVLEEEQRMTYPMERFLQEQGSNLEANATHATTPRDSLRDGQNQGVVMERFLQEPVLVEPATDDEQGQGHPASTVERGASFGLDSSGTPPRSPVLGDLLPSSTRSVPEGDSTATPPRSINRITFHISVDASSIEVNTPGEGGTSVGGATLDDDVARIADLVGVEDTPRRHSLDDHHAASSLTAPESPNDQPPRVLGLTQAEIEELEAIDEVSQQNAPPSERDDLSTSSFVAELVTDFAHNMDHHHGGATTFSQGTPTTAMESTSIQSIRASERTDDQRSIEEHTSVHSNLSDDGSVVGGSASVEANPPSERGDTLLLSPLAVAEQQALNLWNDLSSTHDQLGPDDFSDLATLNAGVVNRQVRPGMVPARIQPLRDDNKRLVRRALSAPSVMNLEVDGFDYDKDAPTTPTRDAFAQMTQGLGTSNNDMWSPGSHFSADPLPVRRTATSMKPRPDMQTDGIDQQQQQLLQPPTLESSKRGDHETEPYIPSIPTQIGTTHGTSESSTAKSGGHPTSVDADDDVKDNPTRSFSSRAMALGITVLVEVPVLVTVFGNADQLSCSLGPSNFALLMSLLPLCCGISGNAGLQSHSLTVRSLASGQLSIGTFRSWFRQEVGIVSLLGVGVGILVGLVAFVLSGFNLLFAVAIFMAQSVSVAVAGVTGTTTPWLLDAVLGHQAPRWSGLILASIQDVVSTFAMVFFTLQILTNAQDGVCSVITP